MDPLESKYAPQSPFVYCSDNSVNRVDPSGMGDKDGSWHPPLKETILDEVMVTGKKPYLSGFMPVSRTETGSAQTAVDNGIQKPYVEQAQYSETALGKRLILSGMHVATMQGISERKAKGYNWWHDVKQFSDSYLSWTPFGALPDAIDGVLNPISRLVQQGTSAVTGQQIVRNLDGSTANYTWDHSDKAVSQRVLDFGLTGLTLTSFGALTELQPSVNVIENAAARDVSNAGHIYAASVTEGGTGTAYAGHGVIRYSSGTTVVPEGTSITMWTGEGSTIPDPMGKLIEAGNYSEILSNPKYVIIMEEGAVTHLPGAEITNATLKAPSNLNIFANSMTVEDATTLNQLLRANMGRIDWAACLQYLR